MIPTSFQVTLLSLQVKTLAEKDFFYTDSRQVSRLLTAKADPHQILAQEIGPAYQEYRHQWEEARTFKRIPDFPLHVDYEMMFRCNLSCPMCLMSLDPLKRQEYGDQNKELSPEKVMELVAYGAKRGQKAMGFGGLWEPLLSPHVPEIVAEARFLGLVDLMINTNGLLLTEKTGKALLDSGLTRLMISLDAATATTYARMRVGSDFDTVTSNIENFMSLKKSLGRQLPLVRLSFCRTAVNEAELPAFLERWEGKVDFFSVQAYGCYPSAAPPGFAQGRGSAPAPAGRCAQPHKRLLVRHNGQVLPCCDASGTSLVLGNIFTQSQTLDQLWEGTVMARLRESLAQTQLSNLTETCQKCQTKFTTQA